MGDTFQSVKTSSDYHNSSNWWIVLSHFLCQFHTGFLVLLPDFVFVGMHCFWVQKSWSFNINQLSWAPLLSRTLCHRTLSSRSLGSPKSPLLNSSAVGLLLSLVITPRISNGTISWSVHPRLPLSFTFPTGLSLLVRITWYSTSYCLLYHLEKEVDISVFHEPPGLPVPCCVLPPADVRVVEFPHEN